MDSSLRVTNRLFSKYAQVNDPLVSDYVQSIPNRLTHAVSAVASSVHFKYLDKRKDMAIGEPEISVFRNKIALAESILKFHVKAGNAHSNIQKALSSLLSPRSQIFVSIHQPNLFAYSGVFKKIVLLQVLKNRLQRLTSVNSFPSGVSFVNLFLIVDHDFVADHWMRIAQLPSVDNGDGVLELKMQVNHAKRWNMVCNMPPPDESTLSHWHKQTMSWLKHSSTSFGSDLDEEQRVIMVSDLEKFWRVVDDAYKKAETYAEFNAFIISNIVNKVFGYDTLFVPLSKISKTFKHGYNFLLKHEKEYRDALNDSEAMFCNYGIQSGLSEHTRTHSPLWLHCKCGSKASTKVINNERLGGICMGCKKQIDIPLHAIEAKDEEALDLLSPRAIPILMLLSRELGVSAYASGTGGSMAYVLSGLGAFSRLHINVPYTVAWGAEDCYFGVGKYTALHSLNIQNKAEADNLAERLRRDLIQYSRRIAPYLELRKDYVKDGRDMAPLLKQIESIKTEQRNLRTLLTKVDKIRRAVSVKPCIIDYAVNFGLEKTVDMWEDNLIKNDSLDAPIIMV